MDLLELEVIEHEIVIHDTTTDFAIAQWKASFFTLLWYTYIDKEPTLLSWMSQIPVFANRMALELRMLPDPLNLAQTKLYEVLRYTFGQPSLEWIPSNTTWMYGRRNPWDSDNDSDSY